MKGQYLLAATLALALALTACGDDLPTGDPSKSTKMDRFGETLPTTVAAGPKDTRYWFHNLVSPEARSIEKPAKVEFVEAIYGCKFEPPGPQDKVVLVTAKEIEARAPVFTFARPDIARRAEAFVAEWKRRGVDPGIEPENLVDGMRLAEVVVTDTSAPLYLVLGGPPKVVWNIHSAEGVRIARVAMIAGRDAAIANLPAGVPVSLIAAVQAEKCNAIPFRRPNSRWGIAEQAKADPAAKDILDKRHVSHSNFDRWFVASFTIDSEQVAIGADGASNFLVGPPPASLDKRVPYRPLGGAVLKMTQSEHVMLGFLDDYRARNEQLVRAQAARLVGGDLAALNRP
jgi:hypothetical protein